MPAWLLGPLETLGGWILKFGIKALIDWATTEYNMWQLRKHLQEQGVKSVAAYKEAVKNGTFEERVKAGEDLLNGESSPSVQPPTPGA